MEEKDINELTAESIVEKLVGKKPQNTKLLKSTDDHKTFKLSLDKNNNVFVKVSPNQEKINDYFKEQWCISQVRKIGVPAPEVLEVGNSIVPYPYIVLKGVEGISASNYKKDKREIIHQLGEYLSQINNIQTNGYGKVFDWSSNKLSKNDTWQDFLKKELKVENIFDIYSKYNILTLQNLKRLESKLKEIYEWTNMPNLNHSNVSLDDVIVDKNGNINAITNWDNANSNIAPYWELSASLWDNLSLKDKKELLKGYGLSNRNFKDIKPYLGILEIIKMAKEISQIIKNKDINLLEKIKASLNSSMIAYT